jgi:hypothetical protein
MLTTKREGGTGMAPQIVTSQELAHRAGNGIDVSLFWLKPTNRVSVEVFDTHLDEGFELEVDGSRALDAFHHPYAYAPSRVLARSARTGTVVHP